MKSGLGMILHLTGHSKWTEVGLVAVAVHSRMEYAEVVAGDVAMVEESGVDAGVAAVYEL